MSVCCREFDPNLLDVTKHKVKIKTEKAMRTCYNCKIRGICKVYCRLKDILKEVVNDYKELEEILSLVAKYCRFYEPEEERENEGFERVG